MLKERIFPKNIELDFINKMSKGTMIEHIGIQFTEIGKNYLVATMPLDDRTKQPAGILHGGASVTLAETLGSVGAMLCIDLDKKYAVGLEINTNHIKSVRNGSVTGKATPIHLGRTTHIWNIEIRNKEELLIAISRITMAILDRTQ